MILKQLVENRKAKSVNSGFENGEYPLNIFLLSQVVVGNCASFVRQLCECCERSLVFGSELDYFRGRYSDCCIIP